MAPRSHRFSLLALLVVTGLLALPAAALAQSDDASLAQERYYSSYGQPAALGQPVATPAAASDPSDGPGWTLALVGGAALLLAGVAFGAMGSRVVVRPRGAASA
jgi:hypothetical protein